MKYSRHFSVETLHKFRPKIVSFDLGMGGWKCYIVGFYLSPDNTLTIKLVVVAVGKRPHGSKMLVVGNFNNYLAGPEGSYKYK